jgi:WD40 repeat protein
LMRWWKCHLEKMKLELIKRVQKHDKDVSDARYAPDGRRLATGSLDTTVIVWDTNVIMHIPSRLFRIGIK